MTSKQSTDGEKQYSEPGEPTCKYCGGPVKTIPTEGASHLRCETHGELQLSEVLDLQAGEINEWRASE